MEKSKKVKNGKRYEKNGWNGKPEPVPGSLEIRLEKARGVLQSDRSSEEEKKIAQRDIQALEFTLKQVRDDLAALGKGGENIKFRGSPFVKAGLEGIAIGPVDKPAWKKDANGFGLSSTWDINKNYDGQIDFLYQVLRESDLLENAHARDLARDALVARQFLEQIQLRLNEYKSGSESVKEEIKQLEKAWSLATPTKQVEIERQIVWARFGLVSFEDAKVNLQAELDLAKGRYLRLLGHDVSEKLNFGFEGAKAFQNSDNGFRSQLKSGMEKRGTLHNYSPV